MTVESSRNSDRLGLLLAILLALTGLLGALIAWRLSEADRASGDAARAGLAATRERARAAVTVEAEVTQSQSAWLHYELAHMRAEQLTAAGQSVEALRAAKEAAASWGFIQSQYIRPDGTYDVAAHRRASLAQQASGHDLDPAPHFAAAAAADDKKHQLALSGILIAGTLPLLAIATVTGGRTRRYAAVIGGILFGISTIAMIVTWL